MSKNTLGGQSLLRTHVTEGRAIIVCIITVHSRLAGLQASGYSHVCTSLLPTGTTQLQIHRDMLISLWSSGLCWELPCPLSHLLGLNIFFLSIILSTIRM